MASRFTFFSDDTAQHKELASTPAVDNINLALKAGFSQRYQINCISQLFALQNKAVDIHTESVWYVNSIQTGAGEYLLEIVTEKHEVSNFNPALNDFIEFSKLFNIPIQELAVKLNAAGSVIAVVNQQQVYNKWEMLKDEILSSLNNDPSTQFIIQNGNNQFSNSVSMLQDTLLYKLFLPAVYGVKQKGTVANIDRGQFTSQLFQEKKIPYTVNENVQDIDGSIVELLHQGIAVQFDTAELKKTYDQVYKETMGEKFDYKIHYNGNYTYSAQTGLMNKCSIHLHEHANENLYYNSNYSIKAI